jgi:hypothetical protein
VKKKQIYYAERFCYRSSVDDWITMESDKDLKYLAEKYCFHVGKDSLYDIYRGF